ncbi:MAG: VCBS repeat-containing protein, partial [Polyangiaceae bacterium]
NQLVGNIAIGSFADGADSPCDEFALAFSRDESVNVFTTCQSPGSPNVFDVSKGGVAPPVPPTAVTLVGGQVRAGGGGVHTGDVNGDGHLDFIVDALDTSAPVDAGTNGAFVTLVAYGLGNGHFSSTSNLSAADDQAKPLTLPIPGFTGPVLAIGQMTAPNDTVFDFVTADQIVLQFGGNAEAGTSGGLFLTPTDQPLTNAVIIDIDQDKSPDVVAGSAGRVDIYRGTTFPILTHALFAVDGSPDQFSFGDFDGDRAIDLAFRASHGKDATGNITADLDVMWGKLLSVPEDPAVVARFGNMLTVGAALISGGLGNNDAVGDIGVVVKTPGETTADDSYTVSVLAGSTSRQLQAPFFIQKTEHDGPALPGQSEPTDQRHSGLPLAFAIGQLTANDRHADLVSAAALQVHPNKSDPTLEMRLVIGPSKGLAALDDASLLYTDVFNTFNAFSAQTVLPKGVARLLPVADWSRISLTTVDLDGPSPTGTDEIIGLSPALLTAGAFFTAKQVGTEWQISPLTSVGARPATRAAVAQVATADVNGDGSDDVLVLSDTGDSTKLVAFMNDKSGQLPSTSIAISLPSYASGATERPFHIVAIAAIDADSEPGKEIAMITDSDDHTGAGGLFLAKLAKGGSFTVTGPFCNGDALGTCVNNPHTRIPSGQAITSADVDGDGVQDLVIESNLTLQVYKGIAVDP